MIRLDHHIAAWQDAAGKSKTLLLLRFRNMQATHSLALKLAIENTDFAHSASPAATPDLNTLRPFELHTHQQRLAFRA